MRGTLGLSEAECYRTSFRQLDLLVDEYASRERAWDLRFGVLAAVQANTFRGKNSAARQPSDYFPSLKRREIEPMSPEQMEAMAKQLAAGRVVTVTAEDLSKPGITKRLIESGAIPARRPARKRRRPQHVAV
jgi:hypothetical protein